MSTHNTEGVTTIKREESVLVAIALFLLAGVIIYNVFSSPSNTESEAVSHDVKQVVTGTTTAKVTEKITEPESEVQSKKVNINTADVKELTSLTGIGEVRAKAIIEYRETYGPFPTVNSLTNVSGIGDKTLAKIIDEIVV